MKIFKKVATYRQFIFNVDQLNQYDISKDYKTPSRYHEFKINVNLNLNKSKNSYKSGNSYELNKYKGSKLNKNASKLEETKL